MPGLVQRDNMTAGRSKAPEFCILRVQRLSSQPLEPRNPTVFKCLLVPVCKQRPGIGTRRVLWRGSQLGLGLSNLVTALQSIHVHWETEGSHMRDGKGSCDEDAQREQNSTQQCQRSAVVYVARGVGVFVVSGPRGEYQC